MTADQRSLTERMHARKQFHARLGIEDAQLRNLLPDPATTASIRCPGLTLAGLVATVMTAYADRPALAERASEPVTDPVTGRSVSRLLPMYRTTTYRQLWERAGAIAAELAAHPEHPVRRGDFVAILGFTSGDYTAVDLACLLGGAVSVPLQAGASVQALSAIVDEVRCAVLAVSAEQLGTAVDIIAAGGPVRRVVVIDHHPETDEHREAYDEARRRLAAAGVLLDTLADVAARGADLPPVLQPQGAPDDDPAGDDRTAMLLYTSGSTGTPKGAIYTDSVVRQLWLCVWERPADQAVIGFNYLPLSHMMGRVALYSTLSAGGTAYFASRSDHSTLFEDMALARPTELLLVPRVCDSLYQRFQSESQALAAVTGDRAAAETEVRTALRETVTGGRVQWVASGSAPLSAETTAFLRETLEVEPIDVYGSTEAGPVLESGRAITRVTDHKLVDVPELGYFTTDAPYPRGELMLKSTMLFPGYFNRPEATADVFDTDGYYRTGDIMARLDDGRLAYVDRRNNVLKLSQGEFVAPARLEAHFATSPLVRQVFVYGSSERSHLLAVVVPTEEALVQAGGPTPELAARVTASLAAVARAAGLNTYEVPRDVLLETEPFSTANGLLSGIRKLLRPRLVRHYGNRLEAFYDELAAREAGELAELRRTGTSLPVGEAVLRAARAALGTTVAPEPTAHFTDLGGDSLAALTFSQLLRDIFAVDIPAGTVVNPANTLADLAQLIDKARSDGQARPTAALVHGSGRVARAADLTLDRFIDAATLADAPALPQADGPVRVVLLTGANGYLGRFVCLEWLERLAQRGGRLICVVRGADERAARARLDAAFDTGDPELRTHYRALADRHLEVLPGDVAEPDLGLDEATWRRLAAETDQIVHVAAFVNHVLPYEQLFGPNVVGTAELIKLALTQRLKRFTYLSTVAAVAADSQAADEDADIRRTIPAREAGAAYADGYATSKWAGEVLLREAHDLCGLPVATFRSDMILAHPRWAGQLNVPDMFTRLLFSLAVTGIAPTSFYVGGRAARAHYDGLPADFTARAITVLGEEATEGYRTYNVVNPHDDGVSLDVIVDWLAASGVRITRVEDFGTWFDRFGTIIRALPEKHRQHSLLPLLHAFSRPAPAIAGPATPAPRFHTAVRQACVTPEGDVPHLTRELVAKYVTDLRSLGLL